MLTVSDFRQTRVFQEALEEGLEKGLEKGRDEAIEKLARAGLLDLNRPIAEIVNATGLTPTQIRKLKKKLRAE